jgi:ABC-type branched-subunit amino acid transport system ATPase component
LSHIDQSRGVMRRLKVRDVALRFGGIVALDGVSFELEEGWVLCLMLPAA